MVKKTWKIPIPKGYYISWYITSQTHVEVRVSMKDDTVSYFSAAKKGVDIDPPLALGYEQVKGNNLEITAENDSYNRFLGTPHSTDILHEDGTIAGKEFILCIEEADDYDYSDIVIRIIGWAKK